MRVLSCLIGLLVVDSIIATSPEDAIRRIGGVLEVGRVNGTDVVVAISLANTDATIDDLRVAVAFPSLKRLQLSSTLANDDWAATVGIAVELAELDVSGTLLTDRGIRHLLTLKKLESLDLGSTKVSQNAVSSIVDLPMLRRLRLSDVKLDEKTFQLLVASRKWKELALVRCSLSEQMAKQIEKQTDLRILDLACNSGVKGQWLKSVASLEQLEELYLASLEIDDAMVKHLTCLTNLRVLDLAGTQVSPRMIKMLSEKLPKCRVFGGAGNSSEAALPNRTPPTLHTL